MRVISTSPPDRKTTGKFILVRYAIGSTDVAKNIRDAAHSIDPGIAIDVTRLEDYLEVWRASSRIVAALAGALGSLALLHSSIGVYRMVSYSVNRSVRDTGIRMTRERKAYRRSGSESMGFLPEQSHGTRDVFPISQKVMRLHRFRNIAN